MSSFLAVESTCVIPVSADFPHEILYGRVVFQPLEVVLISAPVICISF